MILILTNEFDISTDHVIEWLNYYGEEYIRINSSNFMKPYSGTVLRLSNSEGVLSALNNNDIMFSKPKAIWYRRENWKKINAKETYYKDKPHDILVNLENEFEISRDAFFYTISSAHTTKLGCNNHNRVNKFEVLGIAYTVGLKIPDTIVTNSKKELKFFKKKHSSIITKVLGVPTDFMNVNERVIGMYTEEITDEILTKIPEYFYVSLFQKKIEKKIEIRTFYLDGKCYSMAIFSQMDSQTKIDSRRYNTHKLYRRVPYKLSTEIEEKVRRMMKLLNLNTGSIDFILSMNDEMIFLEVNPVGQYNMTSELCNYYLDREIAKYLMGKKELS